MSDEDDADPFEFHEKYSGFAQDQEEDIRVMMAACLHEGFQICSEYQDNSILRDTMHELLVDESTSVTVALC